MSHPWPAGGPPLDKVRIAGEFNRHACTYDRYCAVQKEMAAGVAAQVQGLGRVEQILELGCGTGILTEMLAQKFPQARVTALDLATNMVGRAARRLSPYPQVSLLAADAEHMKWKQDTFDLIVSNAVLQWFAAPEAALKALADALRTGGAMLHATFGPGTFKELFDVYGQLKNSGRGSGLSLPGCDRWQWMLERAGLGNVRVSAKTRQVTYKNAACFLGALKATGAAYTPRSRRGDWAGYSLAREVVHRYDAAYKCSGGVRATFEILTAFSIKSPAPVLV